jgi:hypothetical protein
VTANVTTAALRQVDRLGGLDNYLLHTPDRKLASALGSKLKRTLQDELIRRPGGASPTATDASAHAGKAPAAAEAPGAGAKELS